MAYVIIEPNHNKIFETLSHMGYKIYNTRGIAGNFYTINRKEDLLIAVHEVLEEKIKTQYADEIAWANYMADREDEFGN